MKKAKLLISTALAICMGTLSAVPAFAINSSFTYSRIGDYNSDNKVNVADVTTLQTQLAGSDVVTGTALEHTDFDGDGKFDVNDVLELQKMIVGAEYNCYQKMDNSYKNIPGKSFEYLYGIGGGGVHIDSERLYGEYIAVENELELENNYPTHLFDLITSKEQFCDAFKGESPEFDDEFFEDNALFVIAVTLKYYDDISIRGFSVNENKLNVYYDRVDDYLRHTDKMAYINQMYRLNKADVEDISEIDFYITYMSQT